VLVVERERRVLPDSNHFADLSGYEDEVKRIEAGWVCPI